MPIPTGIHSIVDLLDRAAARRGDATALSDRHADGYAAWPYREVHALVYRLARHLRAQGIGPGDRVGIFMPSCRWWGVGWLAILACDACAVPLDVRQHAAELAVSARDAGLKYCIAAQGLAQVTEALTRERVLGSGVLYIDTARADGGLPGLATYAADPLPRRTLRTDPAVVIYTSGTTGTPKGVVLSHGNLLADVTDLIDSLDVNPTEHFVSILPLHHVYELLGGFVAPLALGASVTYACSLRPDVIITTMRDAGATVMMVVPAFLRALYARLLEGVRLELGRRGRWLHSFCVGAARCGLPLGHLLFSTVRTRLCPTLRGFICGGAPLSPDIVWALRGFGIIVLQGYGLTETSPVIAVNTFHHRTPGSVGRPIVSLDTRIVPLEGETDGSGELWVRGETVFRGYLGNPEATAAAFHGDWFRTGDLVRVNRRGELFVCGRVKSMIVTEGGKNIHPEEIEALLCRSPLIEDACVVGVPVEHGEIPVAVVIPADERARPAGVAVASDALRAAVRASLAQTAEYKRPRRVYVLDAFPRTTTLKVQRARVQEMIVSSTAPDTGATN
jgi:long-chain acyl-CoA synthetase